MSAIAIERVTKTFGTSFRGKASLHESLRDNSSRAKA
jgi:hypothetical protein